MKCDVLYNVVCSKRVSNYWLKFTKPYSKFLASWATDSKPIRARGIIVK